MGEELVGRRIEVFWQGTEQGDVVSFRCPNRSVQRPSRHCKLGTMNMLDLTLERWRIVPPCVSSRWFTAVVDTNSFGLHERTWASRAALGLSNAIFGALGCFRGYYDLVPAPASPVGQHAPHCAPNPHARAGADNAMTTAVVRGRGGLLRRREAPRAV